MWKISAKQQLKMEKNIATKCNFVHYLIHLYFIMLRITRLRTGVEGFIDTKSKPNYEVLTLDTLPSHKLLTIKPDEVGELKWVNGCRRIIHLILSLRPKRNSRGPYVSLYSKRLKEELGNNYTIFLRVLESENIIISDGKYSSKYGISYGYRINNDLLVGQIMYRTITDPGIKRALAKRFLERKKELKVRNRSLCHITRWLTDDYLILDQEHSLQFVDTLKRKTERKLKHLVPKNKKEEIEIKNFPHHRFQLMKLGMERWNPKKLFIIDNAGGRLYNSLTIMPSILRNFLKYKDGRELINVDIKNSQPFHILFLLRKEFWKKGKGLINLHKLDPQLFLHLQPQIRSKSSVIMFPKYSEAIDIQGVDVVNFIQLLTSGKLYEFISDNFQGKFVSKGGFDPFKTRELAKSEFLHMMYFDPQKNDPQIKRVFQEFKKLFPNVAVLIELLKSMSYDIFPILLQKIEVKMLLMEVGKAVFKHDDTIPIFTIHDSLVTTVDHGDTVASILKETYKRLLHHEPRLDCKIWSINDAYRDADDYIQKKLNEKKWYVAPKVTWFPDLDFKKASGNFHPNILTSIYKVPFPTAFYKIYYYNSDEKKPRSHIQEVIVGGSTRLRRRKRE